MGFLASYGRTFWARSMKAVHPALQLLLPVLIDIATNACGDDSGTGPSMQSVTGSYTASSFTVTQLGSTTDVLALGASIDVTLNRNGTTTGTFFLPGGEEDGSDFQVHRALGERREDA